MQGVLIPTGITSLLPPHRWGSWGGLSFILLDICINKPFELKKKVSTVRLGMPATPVGGRSTVHPPFMGLWGYCFRVQPGCGAGLGGAGGCWLVPNPSSQGDAASTPDTPHSWPAPQRRHNMVSAGWTASKQGEDEILLLKAPSRAPQQDATLQGCLRHWRWCPLARGCSPFPLFLLPRPLDHGLG